MSQAERKPAARTAYLVVCTGVADFRLRQAALWCRLSYAQAQAGNQLPTQHLGRATGQEEKPPPVQSRFSAEEEVIQMKKNKTLIFL